MEDFQDIDLGDLLSDQQQDFESLTRQTQAIQTLISTDKPSSVLVSREEYLKHLWTRCEQRNAQIYRTATADDKKELAYFKEKHIATMEKLIFETLDSIAERQSQLQPVDAVPTAAAATAHLQQQAGVFNSQVKLAPLEIAKFSGKPTDWQPYRDIFVSLVKNNRAFDNVNKLWHLRAYLEGEALDIISNMDVTNSNFDIAWDLLLKQYDNKIALTNAHLNALSAIEPIKKESASQIRTLRNTIKKHLGALTHIGSDTKGYDDILINRAVALLDSRTKRDWELSLTAKSEFPTFVEFDEFLLNRIQVLDSIGASTSESSTHNIQVNIKPKGKSQSLSVKSHLTLTTNDACIICKENHNIYRCHAFKQLHSSEQFEIAKSHKWCINCLKPNHKVSECKSEANYFKCRKRHHTLIHKEPTQISSDANSSATNISSSKGNGMQVVNNTPTMSHLSCSLLIPHNQVQLATARVWVLSSANRSVRVRALLDQGSTWSFISRDLARVLGAKEERISEELSGVGGSNSGFVSAAAHIRLSPTSQGNPSFPTTALILPKITSYIPNHIADTHEWPHLANLDLADDLSNDDPVHLLIGANLYGALILNGLKKDNINDPIAQKTVFGWVISGNMPHDREQPIPKIHAHHFITTSFLNTSSNRFWEVEEIPQQQILSVEDEYGGDHFRRTHSRASDGRYVVRIPFKPSVPFSIGRHIAESSLKKLESRLAKDENHRKLYVGFMKEYERLGHMRRVSHLSSENTSSIEPVYLPHHPVYQETSQTTKLRVVFNASSRTSNGTTLNDFTLKGPALQSDLLTIITNWRSYKIVCTADLTKMYRNILLHPGDVGFQRILWRNDPSEPINEYQLLTVTYGTRPAPFLALRVLKQLVMDEGDQFPLTSEILSQDTFVDDLLFGAHTESDARSAQNQVISLLNKGQFQARKWMSNSSALLDNIDPSDHGIAWTAPVGDASGIQILGIHWNPSSDTFGFKTSIDIPSRIDVRGC